jgi:hypothetical protein
VGAAFELDEIKTTVPKLFDALQHRSGTKFAIAALPGLLPFGKANQGLHRGRVDDTTGDTIDNSIPGGSYWLRSILLHDNDAQQAIVESITSDPKILGKRVPKLTKISCKVKAAATPIHHVQFADSDSEELAQPIEDLRQRIAVIRGKLASEIVPKDIATSPPDTPSILGLDSEPVASAVNKLTIPRKPTASLEAYDTTTIVLGRLGLLGGAIDEYGTFTLGSITPALKATLRLSDKKEKIASFSAHWSIHPKTTTSALISFAAG